MSEELYLLLLSAAVLAAAAAASVVYLLYCELKALKGGTRALMRSANVPVCSPRIRSAAGWELWQSIKILAGKSRQSERAKENFAAAIGLTSALAAASSAEEQAAKTLAEVIMTELKQEAAALAVLLPAKDGEMKLVYACGLPGTRAEEIVLLAFYEARQKIPEVFSAYFSPRDGSAFDLRSFGIEELFITTFTLAGGGSGAIWLGFAPGVLPLSWERKNFLSTVTRHAAASFSAARTLKDRDEAAQRERDFLLGLSHDLRAPGNRALYSLRHLLLEKNLPSEAREEAACAEQSIEEQLALITDILDFARHNKGFLRANRQPVAVRQQLEKLLQKYHAEALSRGLKFQAEDCPNAILLVDPKHLNRMVHNLMSNALKYTEKGSIDVSFRRIDSFLEIQIGDSGGGINEALRRRLFREYERGEAAQNVEGAGLGLALTRILAELNGGGVFYQPREEEGSVFTLLLPLDLTLQESFAAPQAPLRTILVVDDDPAVCRVTAGYLRDCADEVHQALSVADARMKAETVKPDVVVADLHLNDGDITLLLEDLPPSTPVLIVSGDAENSVQRPACRFLEKPVEKETICAALRELVAA